MILYSVLQPPLPKQPGDQLNWGQLYNASMSLALSAAAQAFEGLTLAITPDMATAYQLETALHFFINSQRSQEDFPILIFPDWETLPYDSFSPHQDIISQRLLTLYQLPSLTKGIIIAPITTLMHRILPQNYLQANSFILNKGETLDIAAFRQRLETSGYRLVAQVMEHGEYAIRGSLLDLYPMGSDHPYRVDLFDNEVDSIRVFDPDSQRTIETIAHINLLPAREYPITEESITHFRNAWRSHFSGNPANSPLYVSISQGESAAGIEYYLPLFFPATATLFDYLPKDTLLVRVGEAHDAAENFWKEINQRYQQLSGDITRPILPPPEIFIAVDQLFANMKSFRQVNAQHSPLPEKASNINFNTEKTPQLAIDSHAKQPLDALTQWLSATPARTLFCAETLGRREVLLSLLNEAEIHPQSYTSWHAFLEDTQAIGIVTAPLEQGLYLKDPDLCLITESQLFGQQVMQRRLRGKRREQDTEAIVRDLTELKIGDPVVHIDYGIGRYLGLQTIKTGDLEAEYLMLEYADSSKLYVPVASLHLISRYSGANQEHAPLNRLGTQQWDRAKRKAMEKIRDVAAELLDVHARRAAKKGYEFAKPDQHYLTFAAAFPFEETPDQHQTIHQVIDDMTSSRAMDRLVCGDVGFGKTEVAMRAAFIAAQSHKQIAVLVPTTLLAEQHLHNFQNRFAQWPVRVEALSRFRSKKDQTKILEDLKEGKVDIVIGTHKLLQSDIGFKSLGLLIVDEEHRFGVRQKERIKALRAEVDLLTLTATPIPRTLNMALASIRDLSIIATPPARRLSVKTFVREYNKPIVREAILREIMRGGQVYYLHNDVQTIEKVARELSELIPEARIGIAHGQMPEHQLEKIMADFYHQRFNVLVATTIIESGIDIPTANTIIIYRADRFGLAQLHQLRGRVGRSHHQAYAYLLTPPENLITADAVKRLNAIESLEDLGAGFTLATHDLEIRGAGELLGEEQSGHIQEIGFSLYMELLETTVKAMKEGKEPNLEKPLQSSTEIELHVASLFPDVYIPDVHTRLILYKRIANAKNTDTLQDIRAELIDRFGLLPPQTQNLFAIAELKLKAQPFGIRKISVSEKQGFIEFFPEPNIDVAALIKLVQTSPHEYQLVGSERLRFNVRENTIECKIKTIETVLSKLRR
jgi:transcription-repair coupling factor (superfamily II helicase)